METNFMIRIQAGAIIASSNFGKDAFEIAVNEKAVVMHLILPNKQGPYTVLGNICTGLIFVNGSPLIGPWDALNSISKF